MNYEKSVYDLSRFFGSKEFNTITDAANAKFNEAWWKNFGTWGRFRSSNKYLNLVRNAEINVAATVLSVSGEKPLRGTRGYSEYGGTIPKLGHGFAYDENDLILLKQYEAEGTAGSNLIVKDYMNRYSANIGGVHNRLNMFVAAGLSKGIIAVNADNNPDGVKTEFDLKVPTKHQIKAKTKKWSEAGSDPIADLVRAVDLFTDEGRVAKAIVMAKSKFRAMCQNENVIKQVTARMKINIAGNYPLTESEIKTALNEGWGLPPITIINEKSALEIDGVPQSLDGSFAPDMVTILADTNPFEIVSFKSLYLSDPNPQAIIGSTEGQHIASLLRYQSEPMKNITTIECWALPVYKDPNNVIILNTEAV